MTPQQARETLHHLFNQHPQHLVRAVRDFEDGEQARIVAHRHIEPIISELEAVQGQRLDPTYLAYLIEYGFRGED